VFGGMIASTLLAIPFVPVFYVLLESMSERLRKGRKSHPPVPEATHAETSTQPPSPSASG